MTIHNENNKHDQDLSQDQYKRILMTLDMIDKEVDLLCGNKTIAYNIFSDSINTSKIIAYRSYYKNDVPRSKLEEQYYKDINNIITINDNSQEERIACAASTIARLYIFTIVSLTYAHQYGGETKELTRSRLGDILSRIYEIEERHHYDGQLFTDYTTGRQKNEEYPEEVDVNELIKEVREAAANELLKIADVNEDDDVDDAADHAGNDDQWGDILEDVDEDEAEDTIN